MSLPSKREARQKRNREDFIRSTQAAVPAKFRADAGRYAGPTYREHLENQLAKACDKWRATRKKDGSPLTNHKVDVLRGIIRGLATALLIYEDSYNMSQEKLLKIEKQFMKGKK